MKLSEIFTLLVVSACFYSFTRLLSFKGTVYLCMAQLDHAINDCNSK